MNATTIRRIIGVTALVLWVVTICSAFLDEDVRIAYQLDGWAFGIALILTPIYAVMQTIHIGRCRHWLIKTVTWIGCAIVIYLCGMILYVTTMILHSDHRAWSNKDYVVYSESNAFIDPDDLVLYRREGLFDRKMYCLRSDDWGYGQLKYTMYDSFDLIKEESTYPAYFESDSICRDTVFYRLSDGHRYDQNMKDSLMSLIKINKQKTTIQ